MTLRRALVALGCLAVAMIGLAGCGLPVQTSPQAIPAGELPLALTAPSQEPFDIVTFHNATPVTIYLVGPDDQVEGVERYLHAPVTVQKVLDVLRAGPSPSELNRGIQSAIPASANLIAGGLTGGVLTVLLDSTFGSLRPGQATYEFAQIVYSVTALPGIEGVRFLYNGGRIEPQIEGGFIATNYVVTPGDYEQLTRS